MMTEKFRILDKLKYAQSMFYFVDFVQTYFYRAWGTIVFGMTLMNYNKLKIFQDEWIFKEEVTKYFRIYAEVKEERKVEF